MAYYDDSIFHSIESSSNRIKNLYGISDFYNFINKPDNTPSTHRHFQVFFYPEFNNYKQTISKNGKNIPNEIQNNIKDLFNISILEKITLSIQSIDLPQYLSLQGNSLSINTVLGSYNTIGEDQYFDADKTLTFELIDQMKPLFEKFFTKWIFLASIAETQGPYYKYGYPFPKMNVAIKYYREDQISGDNENLHPNFIYYFRGVYPTSYEPCRIAHAFQKAEDISRRVLFKFNTCWVLPNAAFAKRYKLDYLFNTQNQLVELKQMTDLQKKQKAMEAKVAAMRLERLANQQTQQQRLAGAAKRKEKELEQMAGKATAAANERDKEQSIYKQEIQELNAEVETGEAASVWYTGQAHWNQQLAQAKAQQNADLENQLARNTKKLQAIQLLKNKNVETVMERR